MSWSLGRVEAGGRYREWGWGAKEARWSWVGSTLDGPCIERAGILVWVGRAAVSEKPREEHR